MNNYNLLDDISPWNNHDTPLSPRHDQPKTTTYFRTSTASLSPPPRAATQQPYGLPLSPPSKNLTTTVQSCTISKDSPDPSVRLLKYGQHFRNVASTIQQTSSDKLRIFRIRLHPQNSLDLKCRPSMMRRQKIVKGPLSSEGVDRNNDDSLPIELLRQRMSHIVRSTCMSRVVMKPTDIFHSKQLLIARQNTKVAVQHVQNMRFTVESAPAPQKPRKMKPSTHFLDRIIDRYV